MRPPPVERVHTAAEEGRWGGGLRGNHSATLDVVSRTVLVPAGWCPHVEQPPTCCSETHSCRSSSTFPLGLTTVTFLRARGSLLIPAAEVAAVFITRYIYTYKVSTLKSLFRGLPHPLLAAVVYIVNAETETLK